MRADVHGASRRDFLAKSLALVSVASVGLGASQAVAHAQGVAGSPRHLMQGGTRLILLGTAGGPNLVKSRFQTSQVILINDSAYVIDCGNGVTRQLVAADVPLRSIRHVFITHHHDDHNADYGSLLLVAWAAGLVTPIDTWGPPPLAAMTDLFLQLNAWDIANRMGNGGLPDMGGLLQAHEFSDGGVVLEDDNVKVTATLVNHPPVFPAFGYRFDTADRSIVISGDTTRSDNVIALAQGADVLVHEALYAPGVSVAQREQILRTHTPVDEVGEVAAAAGVKKLVLSHLVPAGPNATDKIWIEGASTHFGGDVIVGKDLLEV
jgi:ribonuclease BN (tRNA processing enzyme)